MKERCKNCKVSRSFEDGPLGPEGLKELHPPADDIQRKLKESGQPYHDIKGILILPASCGETAEDDLTIEIYKRCLKERKDENS